ncbi:NAD(+)/NADH kinase [Natronorarus salvus]|uniref:NAD(+)/NADH kinase n=1 Tax=Natronorarus salvus TaxID=3117733 RepID=UPI002F261327
MDVGIVAKRENPRAAYLAEELRGTLEREGATVRIDEATAAALDDEGVPPEAMRGTDLVVSIGGDGTFLFTARAVGDTPILGVNLGEVGFLNAVAPDEALSAVRAAFDHHEETGEVRSRAVSRLQAVGPGWSLPPALNEITICGPQRGTGGGLSVEVRVDGSLYTGGHADGVLLATPTGSTAYNLSEGGPLVHPDLDGVLITEMCARESMPPLMIPAGREITVRVDDAEAAYAIADGRRRRRVEPPERIRISCADEPVCMAGPEVDFFEALSKLD